MLKELKWKLPSSNILRSVLTRNLLSAQPSDAPHIPGSGANSFLLEFFHIILHLDEISNTVLR
jgi:hypothetical protein